MPPAARLCAVLLCALSLAGCPGESDEAPDASDPAARGYADARAAIAEGRPRILGFGMPDFDAGDMDPSTGLRWDGQGCEITDEASAHADAFNAEIRRALDAGQLAGIELRHKATTREAVIAMFAADPGRELTAASGPVAAPGGRFSVEIALDTGGDVSMLWVRDAEAGTRREITWFDGESARVLFSDDGETLYLHDAEYGIVQTHDLPTALFMQGWRDD